MDNKDVKALISEAISPLVAATKTLAELVSALRESLPKPAVQAKRDLSYLDKWTQVRVCRDNWQLTKNTALFGNGEIAKFPMSRHLQRAIEKGDVKVIPSVPARPPIS